ncbi:MAG TPA: DUF1622 domain-containing protein [Ktedonobacteraceae bacterium]|nr:DUF1622 domain-containing protein [Ktedonobacteraceae bacterium]
MDFRQAVELAGTGFEVAGVVMLVIGAVAAFAMYVIALVYRKDSLQAYRDLRRDLGKAILIGLELLVAADIIRSVAVDPTFASIGVLGLIVLIRTFLSWSLEVEINGSWPWQRARTGSDAPADGGEL